MSFLIFFKFNLNLFSEFYSFSDSFYVSQINRLAYISKYCQAERKVNVVTNNRYQANSGYINYNKIQIQKCKK